mgnify:FL=1|jgi:hypothetical protein
MTENTPEINFKKKDRLTKILIILITFMIVVIGILGFLLYDVSKQKQEIIIKTNEIVVEKDHLREQLTDLLDDYSQLSSTNDSLNAEIEREREHIAELIKELDGIKNYNYSIQRKYEKELSSLRKIMRDYVYQIDSLDQLNKHLMAENINIKDQHSRIKNEIDEVVEKNDELELLISGASVVKTSHISIKFLNRRGKETTKSRRVERLQTNFTLVANDLAESGPRKVYLRIIRPNGYTFSSGQTFDFGSKKLTYTAYRDIVYEKQNLDVVIYYDVNETLEIGKYIVELYMDENKIGESFFNIEK